MVLDIADAASLTASVAFAATTDSMASVAVTAVVVLAAVANLVAAVAFSSDVSFSAAIYFLVQRSLPCQEITLLRRF